MSKTTITISQDERKLMLWWVGLRADRLSAFEQAIDHGNRADALACEEDLRFAIGMREALGWDEGDSPVEVELDLDEIYDWLSEQRDNTYLQLGYETVRLEAFERALRDEDRSDSFLVGLTPKQLEDGTETCKANLVVSRREALQAHVLFERVADARRAEAVA